MGNRIRTESFGNKFVQNNTKLLHARLKWLLIISILEMTEAINMINISENAIVTSSLCVGAEVNFSKMQEV